MAAEETSVSGVSGRYATALFELARDEKAIDAVLLDLDKFGSMLEQSADLTRLVRSPVFSAGIQRSALTAVLNQAGISGISANFLKVLATNRRLFVVQGDVGDKARAAYPDLGLAVVHARIDAVPDRAILPDWLRRALSSPSE